MCLRGEGPKVAVGTRASSSFPLSPQDLKARCVCLDRVGDGKASKTAWALIHLRTQTLEEEHTSPPRPRMPTLPPGSALNRSLRLQAEILRGQGGCRGAPNNKSHHRSQVLPGSVFLSACFELSPQQLQHLLDTESLGLPWGLGEDRLSGRSSVL